MATDLEQKPRSAAAVKYDTYVEEQLTKVRGRVRALDAGKITLLLLIVTLAYALGMALVDRALELPAGFRLGAFLIYLVVAAGLIGWICLCLARRINPYYAAKKLEETLPDAKNSVVNWLDLRDEKLPPVIHSALGSRAAKDLKQADPEKAVSAGPTWILAGIMAGLILGLLILFVMGPAQFGSLLSRAFTPFRERGIDTRVQITMVQPVDGNATVPPNRAVTFRASIDGPVPAINKDKAPHLHYRFNAADAFVAQPLDVDSDGAWAWTMPADRVLNGGLWYKITAGDAETPEYLIRVVPNPQVLQIDVTYHYRKYLCKPDASKGYQKSFFTGLHAPRGTEVTLVVKTNSPVTKGYLNVDWSGGKKEIIKGELMPTDPNALRFGKILLDKGGFFSINFTSGAEENIDNRDPHKIVVYEHGKPKVEITKPAPDELTANGTMTLEGLANSGHPEIGIQNMTLRLQEIELKDGVKQKVKTVLESKPYRPGKSFKLVNGKYPPALNYRDLVPLDKLKTDKGVNFPLAKDMVLEYWLEARDNTDYPEANGNLGESIRYRVKIIDPEADKKKQEQERNQAKKEQEKHEQEQNQDLKKQDEAAQKEKQENSKPQTKEDKELEKQKKDLEKQAKDLKDKEKKEKDNNGAAKGGPDQQKDKANSKPGNPDPKKGQQPDDAKAKDNKQGQQSAGEKKEGPKEGNPDKGTEAKGPGKSEPNQKDQATQAKDRGKENPEAGPHGTAKDDKNNGNNEKSIAKDQPPEKQAGNAKDQGANQQKENIGQAKGPEKMKVDPADQANKKEAGKEQPGAQAKESGSGDKTAQKTETKKGPKEDKSQAKDKGPGGETKVSEGKEGPVAGEKDAQGLTKGEDSVENRIGSKDGTRREEGPPPAAKTPGNQNGPPQTASKESTPQQSKDAGQARDEKGPRKQPSAKDIEKWIKDIAKKDPKEQEKAERDLQDARDARDPQVREAAEKALEQANKLPNKAKGPGENGDKTAKSEAKDKGGEGEGQGEAKQGENANAGQGKGDPKPGEFSQAKGGDKAGSFGPGAKGMSDDPKGKNPDADAAKRGGDLTLEDLKSLKEKWTADKRKQSGVTDKEWQQFLKSIQDYENMLNRQKVASKNRDKSKGTGSVMKTVSPYQINPAQNPNVDPLNTGQFEPPPEFRDAQRQFTRPTPMPQEKK